MSSKKSGRRGDGGGRGENIVTRSQEYDGGASFVCGASYDNLEGAGDETIKAIC